MGQERHPLSPRLARCPEGLPRQAYLDAVYGRSAKYRDWLTTVWADTPREMSKRKGEPAVA